MHIAAINARTQHHPDLPCVRCCSNVTPDRVPGLIGRTRGRPLMSRMLDLVGRRFERLTVIAYDETRKTTGKTASYWICRCDCGNEIVTRGSALTTNNTKSCGCLIRETMSRIGKTNGTHRLSRTLEYQSWRAMNQRCYEPTNNRFKYYGKLGVTVCDRWRNSFEDFLADMGHRPTPKHSIDRYPDNTGHYEPTNCRWATPTEQRHNRRDFKGNTQ